MHTYVFALVVRGVHCFLFFLLTFLAWQVMAGIPLLKFEMLPAAKRPQMDASEALTWERSLNVTARSVSDQGD